MQINIYKAMIIYLISYFFFGMMILIITFGFESTISMFYFSPIKPALNGIVIILSALLASLLVFKLMKNRLLNQPYPYFMLGFYIGNLSLLFIFINDAILNNEIIWKFPDILMILFAPFLELLMSYVFGFALMALIPALLSAYILFKVITG